MKHYLLILKESEVSKGTYISVHFYKDASFEYLPELPGFILSETLFSSYIDDLSQGKWKILKSGVGYKTDNSEGTVPFEFSLQEFVLNNFRGLSVLHFNMVGRLTKFKIYSLIREEEEFYHAEEKTD